MDGAADRLREAQGGRRGAWRLILVLALLQGVTPLSIDLYLPALPSIGRALDASQGALQLTLSGFMIGFALGQLAWGPMADRYGRKRPMLIGLAVYAIASAGCALAHGVWPLVGWRVLQALGGCAMPVVGSAMIRDCFGREDGARARSLLMMVGAVAPLLAPLVGGQLMLLGAWPILFWTLTGFGLLALAGVFLLPETLAEANRRELHPARMARDYAELLTHRSYMGYMLPSALTMAGMLAYISGTPFVYIEYFHVPPQAYGLLFGVNLLGMMGASALNGLLVRRFGIDPLFAAGCWIVAAAGVALAVIGVTGFGGLPAMVLALFCYVPMVSPNSANAAAGGLHGFPHKAGAASALMGCLGMGLGAFAGALVGWLADGTPRPMCLVMAAIGVLGLLAHWLLLGRRAAEGAPA